MDVLFYAPSLGEVTGGGRVVVDWATVAAAGGCRVTIATPDGRHPVWTRVEGLSVVERDGVPERPDLVVATIWWTAWRADRWRRRGVRAVHLLQDDERLWATRPDHERIVRAAHRLIPTKVCVSRWVAERCAPPGSTVHLVPPAVAVPTAAPRPPRPGPVVVGLPYRNLSAKGWPVMDAVASRLRDTVAGVRFRVWGPGAPAAVGARYDDVHEPASDAELLGVYDSCDVVLHTSWHDGFPLPPIEAMARRAAVVAAGTGGLAEYAVHGENCLLAAPGDVESLVAAVERVARDGDLRARLVEGGVETARRYSRQRFVASATRTLDLLAA
ncbi:MAG TPA: glycosyltransferase family 4 protein [Candidatus Dormibacteraeota bacterium]|nr:glycosyltransferase family 4 protein [Candidatus Dormibacteraeota bacterium]